MGPSEILDTVNEFFHTLVLRLPSAHKTQGRPWNDVYLSSLCQFKFHDNFPQN